MESGFPTTRYSLIDQLQSTDPKQKKTALDLFIRGYRKALLDFLISNKRLDANDAEDLVHEFIVEKVMSGRGIKAVQNKGKFRNLLRKSLQNFLIDAIRKKKSKAKEFESNSGLFAVENIKDEFDAYDRIWAIGVFTSVLKQMEASSKYWGIFKARVLTVPPLGYKEIVEMFEFEDPAKASNALMTAKRTFLRLVSETISGSDDFSEEDELNDEVEALKLILLDSNEVAGIVDSLESINFPQGTSSRLPEDAIENSLSRELGPIVGAPWGKDDLSSILEHLLENKVGTFLPREEPPISEVTIGELLFHESVDRKKLLQATTRLKQYFKPVGIPIQTDLPQPILVTIVFALIARHVQLGGDPTAVTSLQPDDLAPRLHSLTKQPWIGDDLRELFQVVAG